MFQKMLLPVDGSEGSRKAAEIARDLAAQYGTAVTVLCVWNEVSDITRHQAEEIADRTADTLRRSGVAIVGTLVEYGDAARVIIDCAARNDVDLIVIGSRGRSQTASLLLGSVSHKVANEASCTCITVR